MHSTGTAASEADILAHAIETIDKSNWKRVAQVVSQLTLPPRDLDRVDQLLERNRSGAITDLERAELERYLRVGNFLDLLKVRALRELSQAQAS